MPVYTYRREDGSTFDIKQKFSDDALTQCPTTGQPVVRLIQNAGIVFKGSGFYVNDSKGAKNSTSSQKNADKKTEAPAAETKTETAPAAKEPKETKETKAASPVEKAS